MSITYSEEFVRFIKNVLVNSCYTEYYRQINQQVYKGQRQEDRRYKNALIDNKNDKIIWDNVFYKYRDLFTYYLHLSTDYKNILIYQPKIIYEQIHLSSAYLQLTFQEYIDEQVNFQKVGYREYINFAKSMQEHEFKNKMVEKYRIDFETRNLKNHLVYVVQLLISRNIESSIYFTADEHELMDTTLNPISYFEYINIKREPEALLDNFRALEVRVFDKLEKTL
jgi:hypothetical protein